MKVNFSSLRNEQEDSKPIHKTYTNQSTKFGVMVQRELKRDRERQSKTKMPKCSHSFFGEREKLMNIALRSLGSNICVGLKDCVYDLMPLF